MNADVLLDAIGLLDDRYFETEVKTRVIPWRRRMIALVAAVLIVILSIGTVMAVSSDFRLMVFRFFRIEQPVVIPSTPVDTQIDPGNMIVEPTVQIEVKPTTQEGAAEQYGKQVVTGMYVHTPVATHARDGVFLVNKDSVSMKQGNHYDAYYEDKGELVKLPQHVFNQTYTVHGCRVHVWFEWAEHNGGAVMTWVDPDAQFRTYNGQPSAEAMLFYFRLTWQMENGEYRSGAYPVLLNLYTGEMTELLAGTEAEWMPYFDSMAISQDRTKLLLRQKERKESSLYYVDLLSKEVYSLDELSGEHVDACSLAGNKLICWSSTDHEYKANCYKIWNFDLTTFERTDLFAEMLNAEQTRAEDAGIVFLEGFDGRSHWGNNYTGSPFALAVDENQTLCLIDLASGEKVSLPEMRWQPGMSMNPSSDGSKLLMTSRTEGELDIGCVAVVDYDRRTVLQFYRDNPNQILESMAYWYDANTVVVCSEVYSTSLCTDYYFYKLQDSK